jgi:hypothetical protein
MKIRIVKKGLPKAQYQNSQITNSNPSTRFWHSEWDEEGFDTDPASPLYQPSNIDQYIADDKKGFDMLKDWYNPKGTTSRKEMKSFLKDFNTKYSGINNTKLKLPMIGPKGQALACYISCRFCCRLFWSEQKDQRC